MFTTTRSASSTMPRFTPCSSSPAPGASSSTNTSTIPATATSDWPTPTVSTSTTSKPAASHTSIASRVRRATPPSVPLDGDGRMNARGVRDSCSMRVLSPRIDPPPRVLDGSTASTATSCPAPTRCETERLDERRLPRARRAADADTGRSARSRAAARRGARPRRSRWSGARRLDERDRASERSPVAGAHRVGERTHRRTRASRGGVPRINVSTSDAACRMLLPGPKIAATPASCRNS